MEQQDDRLQRVTEAVLLWFSSGPWTAEKADRWLQLTGTRCCTDKALCDWLRRIQRASKDCPG